MVDHRTDGNLRIGTGPAGGGSGDRPGLARGPQDLLRPLVALVCLSWLAACSTKTYDLARRERVVATIPAGPWTVRVMEVEEGRHYGWLDGKGLGNYDSWRGRLLVRGEIGGAAGEVRGDPVLWEELLDDHSIPLPAGTPERSIQEAAGRIRIEQCSDGSRRIAVRVTGAEPDWNHVRRGWSPILPLRSTLLVSPDEAIDLPGCDQVLAAMPTGEEWVRKHAAGPLAKDLAQREGIPLE